MVATIFGLDRLPGNGIRISIEGAKSLRLEQDNFWFSIENRNSSGVAHALDAVSVKISRFLGKGIQKYIGKELFSNKDFNSPVQIWSKINDILTPEAMEYYKKERLLLLKIWDWYHSKNKGVSVSEQSVQDDFDPWASKAEEHFTNLGDLFNKWFDHNDPAIPLFIEKNQWNLRYRFGVLARAFEETSDYETLYDIFSKLSTEELQDLSLKSLKQFIDILLYEEEEYDKAEEILSRTQELFTYDAEEKYYYYRTQGWLNEAIEKYQISHSFYLKAHDSAKISGTWDRRFTESASYCIRSALCSENDIDEHFEMYLSKSQDFGERPAIHGLNIRFLKSLRLDVCKDEEVLESSIESLLEDSKLDYSPESTAIYYLQCARDIFEWGVGELNALGLKYAQKSLVIYQTFGRWRLMIEVLTLLAEKETNDFLKPAYEDQLKKAHLEDKKLDSILDLSTWRTDWNLEISDEKLLQNKLDLDDFYAASIQLNQTYNIQTLLPRRYIGQSSDWSLIHDYSGLWGRLYGLTKELKTWKDPVHYEENLTYHIALIREIYTEIGTPFAEAYALDRIALNPKLVGAKEYSRVIFRLNELLIEQGSHRLRYINLERIARTSMLKGMDEIAEELYVQIIKFWAEDYPQNALYTTQHFAKHLLDKGKTDQALSIISALKQKGIYSENQIIELNGLEGECYSKMEKEDCKKGVDLLSGVTQLIFDKKYINRKNMGRYGRVLSINLALLHRVGDEQAKSILLNSIEGSDFTLSDIYYHTIMVLEDDFEPSDLVALYLEKSVLDFKNEDDTRGFINLARLCKSLSDNDTPEFVIQSQNYLQLAIEKVNLFSITQALHMMSKKSYLFSSDDMQDLCSTTLDHMIKENCDLKQQAHYLFNKSRWYNFDDKRNYLNSAFEIFIQINDNGQASWCLQELYSEEPTLAEVKRKLIFDIQNDRIDGVISCFSPIQKLANSLDKDSAEEIIKLLDRFSENPKLEKKHPLKIRQIIIDISFVQKDYETVLKYLEKELKSFPERLRPVSVGQKWLEHWEKIAEHYDNSNIFELLDDFIVKLESYRRCKKTWSQTIKQAKELRKKLSKPVMNLHQIQNQIMAELKDNPQKAESLLRSLIKNQKKNLNLEKHLKSILSKAKGTHVEEILLLYFIDNSPQGISRERWLIRLLEHYQTTQLILGNLANASGLNKLSQQMQKEPIQMHRVLLKWVKNNFTTEQQTNLFGRLAFTNLEQRKFDIAIEYHKRLLMNPNTDEAQHALYVYRLALCEAGRDKLKEAKEWFYDYILLEENEINRNILRSNFGVFLLELGDLNGGVILTKLYEKDGEVVIVGKGDPLRIEGYSLIGNNEHSELQIKNSQLETITNQVERLSRALKNGNDVYVIILDEEKEVMELKLPALQPLKLNFHKMYQNDERFE